jgi:hypothetical protein
MHKVNLTQKLRQFSEHWSPRIVGELNGQQIKVAKLEERAPGWPTCWPTAP